ncbi:MAG: dTDP-glucose 4,6-dehydratase [Labilithrix sp.]|nr:dTDP-glucose 4,6-dehydratase [Labilithrix sp.]
MKTTRVLVLGGAGFLGSHLCDRLLADGDEVIAMDNLQTGSRDNIAHLAHHRRFSFLEHDIEDPFFMPVDRIYNLACPASPPRYQIDPIKTTLTSVIGTRNALELGRRTGARVLLTSTSEVYGDPEVHPQHESYRGAVNTVGPRSCYDEGKRCAESLMADYGRVHGVEVRIARLFNTYGPRMDPDDGRIVSNLICQALRGEDLTIYGDGSQTRSFCYVDDMIDGLVRLMDHPTESGPVNLGTPREFTILELAHLVLELTGREANIVYEKLPQDDPKRRKPDIERARRLLGFDPRVQLVEGLGRTIAHFEAVVRRAPAIPTSGPRELTLSLAR